MPYHFSPPSGWMNDPNGLIYFDGEWHLFYQHLPPGETRQHWGHAVSRDLLQWEHLPIALYPDELGSIWSGSVVVDEHDSSGFFAGGCGLVAFFTHQVESAQRQSLAYSRDRGRTWTKYAGNPVLTSSSPDFRDPKVIWFPPANAWVMVVTAGSQVQFYHSTNLTAWMYAGCFGPGWAPSNWTWECPDLFTLPLDGDPANLLWVLHASLIIPPPADQGPQPLGHSQERYFIGAFDGRQFTPLAGANQPGGWPTNYGADDYAAIVFSNAPQDERLLLGWMGHWAYAWPAHHQGKREWMTLPRRLSLRRTPAGIRLCQQPLSPFANPRPLWDTLSLDSERRAWPAPTGEAFVLQAEFEAGDAAEFGFILRQGGVQQTVIGYDAASQSLFVDRTQAGDASFHPQFAARHAAPLALPQGRLRLSIFADACSVEVTANEGEVCITDLIYPDPQSQGLQVYSHHGRVHLLHSTLSQP